MLSLLQSTIFCFCMYSISRCSTFAVFSGNCRCCCCCSWMRLNLHYSYLRRFHRCYHYCYCLSTWCIFYALYMYILYKLLLFLRSLSKISRFFHSLLSVCVVFIALLVYYTLACEGFTAKFSVYSFKTYLKDTNRWDIEKRQSCYFLFRWKVFEFSFLFCVDRSVRSFDGWLWHGSNFPSVAWCDSPNQATNDVCFLKLISLFVDLTAWCLFRILVKCCLCVLPSFQKLTHFKRMHFHLSNIANELVRSLNWKFQLKVFQPQIRMPNVIEAN